MIIQCGHVIGILKMHAAHDQLFVIVDVFFVVTEFLSAHSKPLEICKALWQTDFQCLV